MYINIIVLFLVLFITFCIVWKNELVKNLFYTLCFILTLWINIPCFVSTSVIDNSLLMFPFRISKELGFLYTIFSNLILSIVLFLQVKFSHNSIYTYKSIKKKFDDFGNDAMKLYIIGKDLDFLGKDKFKKQRERIIHLGVNCNLLCECTTNEELIEIYTKVYKKGVGIKFYGQSDNITNLKGQIKIDQSGNKKAIFVSRQNNKYMLLNIENQFLVASILERYLDVYEKSKDFLE